jgi:hypothetical protein
LNTRLLNTFAVAVLVWLVLPAVVAAQRITSLTTTAKGKGRVTISDVDKHKISAVLVILRENGKAEITLYADMQLFGQGTWSMGDDLSKGIDLKITGGIVSGNAAGTEKLFLRDDGKSISKLTITAGEADGIQVKVEFTAEEKAKASPGTPES